MSKINAPLLAFNRGETSKSALSRVDIEKMRLAAESQVNWMPTVVGAMSVRPGTKYLGSTRGDAACQMIPFVFGSSDAALLEVTDSHIRVWRNDAVITRPSVATAVTNGDFSSATGWTLAATSGCTADINSTSAGALYLAARARGGVVSCLRSVTVAGGDQNVEHALRIVITRGPVTFMVGSTSGGAEYIARSTLDAGTHSLTFTPTGGTFYIKFESRTRRDVMVDSIAVEAAGSLDLPAPWVAADLPKLRWDQSGDIVFVACEGYQQYKIERRSATGWGVVLYRSDDGPFSFIDTGEITLTPSVYEGNGTLTASAPMFLASDVGKMFRIFSSGQTKQAILGAQGALSESLRVTGVDGDDRTFNWVVAGTWVGTISLERSIEGPDVGFKEVETTTANATTSKDDHVDFANVIAWYRMVFKTYTSGSAAVSFTGVTGFDGGGIIVQGPSTTSGDIGICRITSYSSATVANIEVLRPFAALDATSNWQPGDWSSDYGWPTTVRFFEGRLWWFRGNRRWGSVSDDFYSYDLDVEGDSAPINRSFGSGPVDKINWALDLARLVIGRERSIDPVRSTSFDEPLTATNNTTKSCSTDGAAAVQALKVGNQGIYVENSGRRVYDLRYASDRGDYASRDLTLLNDQIGIPGFVSLAVQQQPDPQLHFVRTDGQDAVLLYEPDQDIACWWRIQTLGVIENVVTLPGSLEDAVYFIVKRTINSSTKRFLERVALRSECVGGSLNKLADCHVVVSQASSAAIAGLGHLEGETVVVWANGKDLGTYAVSAGAITASEAVASAIVGLGGATYSYDSAAASGSLTGIPTKYNGYPAEVYANGPNGGRLTYRGAIPVAAGSITLPKGRTAKKIIAYLGYYAPFRSAKLAYGAQMGTALAQSKKVEKIGVILQDTHYQGLQYGSDIDNLQPLPLVVGGQDVAADTVFEEHEEPMIGLSGSWSTDSRLHLLAQAPRPCTIAGVVIAVNTSEAR